MKFLLLTISLLLMLLLSAETPAIAAGKLTRAQFESDFLSFLNRWHVPGASIAVGKKGKLVYAKGFGWADREDKIAAGPDTLYRIASISKSITAMAALKLREEGKLNLDEKVFDILADIKPIGGEVADKRIYKVKVRDLLLCTGGWSSKSGGEPMFMPELLQASQAANLKGPPPLKTLIGYAMRKPLAFDPGTSWGYTNFGYALLGEVISQKSGVPYEQYVQEHVLKPLGITTTLVGKTVLKYPAETIYYPYPGQPTVPSIFPENENPVYWQYGGDFDMDLIAAPAGWISSAPNMVRLVSGVCGDDPQVASPLSKDSVSLMLMKPTIAYWKDKVGYFAMGWEVYPTKSGYTFSRVGTMPGTMAFVVHRYDGLCWSVAFNSRPEEADKFMNEAKSKIWSAVNAHILGN